MPARTHTARRDHLATAEGVPADRFFPISAATGRGVQELVRGVRKARRVALGAAAARR